VTTINRKFTDPYSLKTHSLSKTKDGNIIVCDVVERGTISHIWMMHKYGTEIFTNSEIACKGVTFDIFSEMIYAPDFIEGKYIHVLNLAGEKCDCITGNSKSVEILQRPIAVEVDGNGILLVADEEKQLVQILDKNGNFLQQIVTYEGLPVDLAISPNGDVVVASKYNIVIYTQGDHIEPQLRDFSKEDNL